MYVYISARFSDVSAVFILNFYCVIHVNISISEAKRDTEIELITEGTGSITPEQGLVLSPPVPKSIELINSVKVSSHCYSVYTYKGIT